MNKLASILIIISLLTGSKALKADDGYQLWLKFDPIKNTRILNQYRNSITGYLIRGNSPTLQLVKEELQSGLEGLLDQSLAEVESIEGGTLIVGTYKNILEQARIDLTERMSRIGSEGFVILHAKVDKKTQKFIQKGKRRALRADPNPSYFAEKKFSEWRY